MDYLIISTSVIDVIYPADGTESTTYMGGAGLYALSGAKLFSDEVSILTGKGADFDSLCSGWYQENRIDTDVMFNVAADTPRTNVVYQQDGERIEIPVFGADHYGRFIADIADIGPVCKGIKGLYLFKGIEDLDFWKRLIELKHQFGFKLLWEISADAALPDNLDAILHILKDVDILSINRTEACGLFLESEPQVVYQLLQLPCSMTFYRRGPEGSYIIQEGEVTEIPSIIECEPVDPTGAGNSSSGAVLVGYCEGKSPFETGLMGSIAAGFSISDFGPMKTVESYRVNAKKLLQQYKSKYFLELL